MATISHITAVSDNILTAFRYAPPFAVFPLYASIGGKLTPCYQRPVLGRKAGYTGKVVCSRRTGCFFTVEAENSHSLQVSDIVWLNDSWQVVSSPKWVAKSDVVVCR